MERHSKHFIENWTVDYGQGPEPAVVPHAWRQDVSVEWEGPAIYRTEIEVPRQPSLLRFHGVSYRAEVFVDGEPVQTHTGIWDAFDVPLTQYAGRRISIEVHVTKNGGTSFPVKEVASGFLPFVYNTFGGIHGEVELISPAEVEYPGPNPSRISVENSKVFVDGQPFYMRGILHWGWYPELGHTSATAETIRAEVQAIKGLGFNTVKFCLWVPPHSYLQVLDEEGMFAWLELPLWDPSSEEAHLASIGLEIERIVRQYRQHDNIICWTVGCELSAATTPEFRCDTAARVRNLTRCPLVKDNSGGAEMYGGDLREFGTFDDFHPYCDTPFYPEVLDSLLPGPRPRRPMLLGEFNDIDVHRDLSRLGDELPFWSSNLAELNAQGVRWLHDLPAFLPDNRFSNEPRKNKHRELMESSRRKGLFIRKHVQETVRARSAISGYVITGLRDTPISTAGIFDDWAEPRYSPEECQSWNGPEVLFLIPSRRPPWIHGGNRPGWIDPFNHFAGQVFFRVGVHCESGVRTGLVWEVKTGSGETVRRGATDEVDVHPLESVEVAQLSLELDPGTYILQVEFANAANAWTFNVFEKSSPAAGLPLLTSLPSSFTDPAIVVLAGGEGTVPMPFWRESANEFTGDAWGLAERWERLLAISPDCALDPARLPDGAEVVINRIDTRTYAEHPIAVKIGNAVVTTLRPGGGLGSQPLTIERNPSGAELLRRLQAELS